MKSFRFENLTGSLDNLTGAHPAEKRRIMTDEGCIVVPARTIAIPGNALSHIIENIRMPYSWKIVSFHRSDTGLLFQTRVYIPPRVQAHHEHPCITAMSREGSALAEAQQKFIHIATLLLQRGPLQLPDDKFGVKVK